jgi:hypothetical protein
MIEFLIQFENVFFSTIKDVAPIVILIGIFQILVLNKTIPDLKKVTIGVIFVILGLTFFLIGLEKALFPVGEIMGKQLSEIGFVKPNLEGEITWKSYYWIYIFSSLIGFATTIAEPSLIAVAIKAHEVSGGTINKWGLRLVVALGVSIALFLGTLRIVIGAPLYVFILSAYVIVIILTIFTPKDFIPLAYDLGGVTTSTVTVPVVTAIGLGLATNVPGRNPALDGFGLIAFACLFPIITVMIYVQILKLLVKFKKQKNEI